MADTETTFMYADAIIPWYQTSTNLRGFLWVERDGQIIGGDMENPSVEVPPQTGDTQADLASWIASAISALMAPVVAPDAFYNFGNVLGIGPWGVDTGILNGRKAVALAYFNDFTFNFTPPLPNGYQHPRVFKFRIEDTGFGNADTVAPTIAFVEQFETDHAGRSPVLLVLEATQK